MSEQVITRESVCEDSRDIKMFIFNIKKKKSFQGEICGTEVLGREKKINKGKGCGMQGVFGKEEMVCHEWFSGMFGEYWGMGLKT